VIAQSNRYDQLRPLLPIRPTEQSRAQASAGTWSTRHA